MCENTDIRGHFSDNINNIRTALEVVNAKPDLLKAIISYIGVRGEENMTECIFYTPIQSQSSTDMVDQDGISWDVFMKSKVATSIIRHQEAYYRKTYPNIKPLLWSGIITKCFPS